MKNTAKKKKVENNVRELGIPRASHEMHRNQNHVFSWAQIVTSDNGNVFKSRESIWKGFLEMNETGKKLTNEDGQKFIFDSIRFESSKHIRHFYVSAFIPCSIVRGVASIFNFDYYVSFSAHTHTRCNKQSVHKSWLKSMFMSKYEWKWKQNFVVVNLLCHWKCCLTTARIRSNVVFVHSSCIFMTN